MELTGKRLKQRLRDLLTREDLDASIESICRLPLRKVISHLISFFYNKDELLKWRSITATGRVVSLLAARDMESARVIMRRLMWNLNDESGGIGWGSPEAMGEIMAGSEKLADEYAAILKSYICKGKNFIEYEPLQRGVIWGLGRLALARPGHVKDVGVNIFWFLGSGDPFHRGFAAWALGNIKSRLAIGGLEGLVEDHKKINIYLDANLIETTVSKMAKDALAKIARQ